MRGMSKKHRIGLKYCGGCNQQYDRVGAVERIKACLEDKIEFVSYRDENLEGILVVTGCPTACVDMKPFEKYSMWVITSEQDAEGFIKKMIEVENMNGLERDIQK